MATEEHPSHSVDEHTGELSSPIGGQHRFADLGIAREEWVIVLDFLQHGYASGRTTPRSQLPIVQAIGRERFALLELIPKKDVVLQPREEVYIGDGKRDKIHHIKGRLPFDQLTATAQSQIESIIMELVMKSEARFVDFFNKAQPMTTRMHQLELLPGLGKKHMWEIIDVRKEKPFASFQDIRDRVRLMPDPRVIIVRRILGELSGKEKHRVFVR